MIAFDKNELPSFCALRAMVDAICTAEFETRFFTVDCPGVRVRVTLHEPTDCPAELHLCSYEEDTASGYPDTHRRNTAME